MKINDKKNNRKPANNNAGNTDENTENSENSENTSANRKSSDPDSAGSGSPSDQEEASDDG